MGRHPKPTAVLKLEKGKLYDVQRDREAFEPQAQREIRPACPKNFTAAERKVWRHYARLTGAYGLFQGGNAGLLQRLATACVLHEQLRNEYLQTAMPNVGMAMLRVGRDIDAMEMTLGLPSVARAKLGSLMLKAKKEKEEFFND